MSGRKHPEVPSFKDMIVPVLKAMRDLGGSGTIHEINERATRIARVPDEIADIPHGNGSISAIDYQMAWTRTYLKNAGLIESTRQGVWKLVSTHIDVDRMDAAEILKKARAVMSKKSDSSSEADEPEEVEELDWKEDLLQFLKSMDPYAFERLTKLILRESGFTQVEVTKQSSDGGIDGIGILKLKGVLSFHVLFQCKRYQGSVGAGPVRDFRGAMQGRSDKGLLITTGRFTREAMAEAKRDGAPPIELIDGDELCELMKKLGVGLKVEMVEEVSIDKEWLGNV